MSLPQKVDFMIQLTDVCAADLPAIVALNETAVPLVNSVDLTKMHWFLSVAAYFRKATIDDRLAGFLIALDHNTPYASVYFDWFCARYRNFIYIDRIVGADWTRGQGVGRAMYQDVERFTAARAALLASDVYSDPPNTPSLQFHYKFGFTLVGSQPVENGAKTAAKFLKTPALSNAQK